MGKKNKKNTFIEGIEGLGVSPLNDEYLAENNHGSFYGGLEVNADVKNELENQPAGEFINFVPNEDGSFHATAKIPEFGMDENGNEYKLREYMNRCIKWSYEKLIMPDGTINEDIISQISYMGLGEDIDSVWQDIKSVVSEKELKSFQAFYQANRSIIRSNIMALCTEANKILNYDRLIEITPSNSVDSEQKKVNEFLVRTYPDYLNTLKKFESIKKMDPAKEKNFYTSFACDIYGKANVKFAEQVNRYRIKKGIEGSVDLESEKIVFPDKVDEPTKVNTFDFHVVDHIKVNVGGQEFRLSLETTAPPVGQMFYQKSIAPQALGVYRSAEELHNTYKDIRNEVTEYESAEEKNIAKAISSNKYKKAELKTIPAKIGSGYIKAEMRVLKEKGPNNFIENREDQEENSNEKKPKHLIEEDIQIINLQQSHIGNNRIAEVVPARILEQEKPKEVYKPAEKLSWWGSIKHGMYTALCALSTITIGGLGWLVTAPFTTRINKTKSITTKKDTSLIPGSKKEKFDMTLPEDDNQPILNDKRRIPLVYEEQIPEDPDLKPTVSFNFTQDEEGRSVDDGNSHGFVTIKYSKKDPISGKMQRYKSSFGFYAKGGFRGMNTTFAIGQNGMYIPGQLRNDSGCKADIGVEFEVSNKQINQVILAAQKFEEGGYNVAERNCCTFAHDMGVAAGLGPDVDKFMKIQDLNSGSNGKIIGAGALNFFAGPIISRLGRNEMIDMAEKEDLSYQQFGNKMINEQDIKHLSKRSLNVRLCGYFPSTTAENIRNMQGVKLKSEHYGKGTFVNNTQRLGENSRLAKMTSLAGSELSRLRRDIVNNSKDKKISKDVTKALNEITVRINKFKTNMNLLLEGKKLAESGNDMVDMSLDEKLSGISQITKTLNEGKNQLNEIYYNKLNGNKKLNIRFQHMTALFEHFQSIVNDEYAELKKNKSLDFINGSPDYFNNAKYKGLIDYERDSSTAIKNYQYGIISLQLGSGKPAEFKASEYVAALRTFGSVDNYILFTRLKEKKDQTPREKEVLHELSKRETAFSEFKSAEDSFLSDRKFTAEDYKFALIDLPIAEMKSKSRVMKKTTMKASEVYQSIAMERAFPGLKKELKNLSIDNIINNPDEFKRTINDFLKNKFEDKNNKELNKLQESVIEYATKKNPVTVTKDNYKEYLNDILYKSHRLIMDSFKRTYLKSIVSELVNDKVADLDQKMRAKTSKNIFANLKIDDMDFDRDPSFESFREAAHNNTGVVFDAQYNVPQEIKPDEGEVREDKVGDMLKM